MNVREKMSNVVLQYRLRWFTSEKSFLRFQPLLGYFDVFVGFLPSSLLFVGSF